MDRYSISTYDQAMTRIRAGWLYDVGQISPDVLTQLHMAATQGLIKRSMDSWPLRGCGNATHTVFESVPKRP